MKKWYLWAAGSAGLFLLSVGYLSFAWGVWPYVFSVSGTIMPSPNTKKTAGNMLFKPNAKGEVLLVHGLNFEADKMMPLAHVFFDAGFLVKVPRLAGHRGNLAETFYDPTPNWIAQFGEIAKQEKGPTVCAGYSMGGLLVVERFLAGQIQCAKFVLFAPAFASLTPEYAAAFLQAVLPASFQVPSGIPGDYKHFDRLGLAPTFATLNAVRRLHQQLKNLNGKALPPGLIFSDVRDSVVDGQKMRDMVREYFPQWRVVDLEALPLEEHHAFHMVIDEPHLGATQWSKMTVEINAFLKQ